METSRADKVLTIKLVTPKEVTCFFFGIYLREEFGDGKLLIAHGRTSLLEFVFAVKTIT